MTNLIIGCGYLGQRVGQRWLDMNKTVYAVTRSTKRSVQLAKRGYATAHLDVTVDEQEIRRTLCSLPEFETVLWSVGYDRAVYDSIQQVYVDGLRKTLSALENRCQRFIYISSTGVYAQTAGESVDEFSPCHPTTAGGQACLAAEQLIQTSQITDRIILRLAGIYGPARVPRAGDIRDGQPIEADPDSFLNLIHVDDAANIVCLADEASAESAKVRSSPELYLVSDGNPVQRRDYYGFIADQLQVSLPTFVAPRSDSSRSRRGQSNKRITNEKLVKQLNPTFRFPSYHEGLSAELRQSGDAG